MRRFPKSSSNCGVLVERRGVGLARVAAVVGLIVGSAIAQDSNFYEIPNSTQSGGGGISSGGEFEVVGSIGQASSGPMQGSEFEVFSGYIATECVCSPTDFNCDGIVNGEDLTVVIANWGECPGSILGCTGDVNADGKIDGVDLTELLSSWD